MRHTLTTLLSQGGNLVLDILFPIYCLSCGRDGTYLCTTCQQRLDAPIARCIVCSKNAFLGETHPNCRSRNEVLDGVLVARDYHKPEIRALIWNYKYNGVKDLSDTASTLMADYFFEHELGHYFKNALITEVPLHKRRIRERGFNQAELLATLLSQKISLEYAAMLARTRYSRAQVKFQKKEKRKENLKNVFSYTGSSPIKHDRVLLVDDVATTGTTLNECAKVLKQNGAREVWGFVLARN